MMKQNYIQFRMVQRIGLRQFSLGYNLERNKQVIYNATKRPNPVLTEEFRRMIQNDYKHPKTIPIVDPSPAFTKSVSRIFDKKLSAEKEHINSYLGAGVKLNRYMKHRIVPLPEAEIKSRHSKIEKKIKEEFSINSIEDTEDNVNRKAILSKLKSLTNSGIPKWSPIEYDSSGAITHLLTRTPAEFASLKYIFSSIKQKLPNFQPKTFFDFGSGVGCGIWAFRDTFGEVMEAFCVDPSPIMNDFSRSILGDGGSSQDIPAGISFRMQLPATVNLKYDLVLCSHTLLELPSAEERLSTIHSLWDRVEPGGCLVLLDIGSNAGFHLVTEARDYLSQLNQLSLDGELDDNLSGHVLAPCPHDSPCPRYSQDTIPCNFAVRYRHFDMRGSPEPRPQDDKIFTELISYVVFSKSKRESLSLPRLVESPLKTKGNMYCRMCTPNGSLQEVICKKKQDKELYQLAKRLRLGDELPVDLEYLAEDKPKVGLPWLKNTTLNQAEN